LDVALKVLPRYYPVDVKWATECLVWYFNKPIDVQREVSKYLSRDRDDAVAWELHEIVEACEYRRMVPPSSPPPNWLSEEWRQIKPLAHKKATEIELKFLRDIGREDLVLKVMERETLNIT
jgi:hypothetical protein